MPSTAAKLEQAHQNISYEETDSAKRFVDYHILCMHPPPSQKASFGFSTSWNRCRFLCNSSRNCRGWSDKAFYWYQPTVIGLFYLFSMFPVEKYNFSLILTGLAKFSGKKQSFQAPKYARYICLSFLHNLLPSYRLSKGSADHEHYSNTLTLYTSHYTVRVGDFGQASEFGHPLCWSM